MNDPNYPVDEDVELALLGKVLLDQSLEGLEMVKAGDFYFGRHQEIYARMRELWDQGQPLDPMLIADRDLQLLSVMTGAMAIPEPLTPANAYGIKLRDLAKKRSLIPFLSKVAGLSANGASFDEVRQFILEELDTPERQSDRDTWQIHRASELREPPAPREWLLDGLIYRGQISMMYGPPGIGKTLFLMDACAAMATGQNWLVRRSWQADHATVTTFHATRPSRILWLDYDNGQFETEIRIRAALLGREGLENAPFFFMSETVPWLALDNASHVRRVTRMALEVGADVIVFDALGMVLGEVDENSPDVARVIAKLKEIRAATGAAILAVHHPSKAGAQTAEASTYNAAGSAKFSNFFEWSIELRSGEEKGAIIAQVVKHRGWAKTTRFAGELEYTHFGKEEPELAHELKTFTFYPYAVESAGEKREATIQRLALESLAGGPLVQKALIDAITTAINAETLPKIGENTIRATVKAMVGAGLLITSPQSAPRQPLLYSLPNEASVDSVDGR